MSFCYSISSISIYLPSNTNLVNRLDFLSSSNASVGPSVRDLGELGTHHRAFHGGRSEDVCRSGISEG